MARGKALVAKLRKDPKVVDAEALAAWIGRRKKLLKSGVSAKKAVKLAGKEGGMKQGGVKGAGRGGSSSKAERKAPTSKASDSELIRRWGTADRAEIRRKQDEIMARQRAGLNLARKSEKTGPGRGRPEKSNGPKGAGPGKLKDGRTSTYEGKKFTEVKDSSGEARGTIMQEKDGSFKVYLKNPEQYEGLQGGTNGPYPANRERLIFRGDTKAEVKKKFTEFLAKADKRRKKK